MNFLLASLTERITEQVKNQLPQILPEEVSNFSPRSENTENAIEGLIKLMILDRSISPLKIKCIHCRDDEKQRLKMKTLPLDQTEGDKSQLKSFGKSVQLEEPEFEVADLDMPQDQEGNLGNDDEEPKEKAASKRDWFTKPIQPQEPADPNWNVGKTPQQGLNQSWLMTLASSADKPSKTFD
ncbi:hypothetical protein Tco_0870727 [Tanacetum coccineum]